MRPSKTAQMSGRLGRGHSVRMASMTWWIKARAQAHSTAWGGSGGGVAGVGFPGRWAGGGRRGQGGVGEGLGGRGARGPKVGEGGGGGRGGGGGARGGGGDGGGGGHGFWKLELRIKIWELGIGNWES